mgnify:CR=1 FL=1
MPEIPDQHTADKANSKPRQTRRRTEGPDYGIYGSADSTDYLTRQIVPILAEALGASQPTMRGMRGLFGSIGREMTLHRGNGDVAYYGVTIERTSDTDRWGNKLAEIALEVVISETHTLDDHELLTEWPLLESVGAGDGLVVDSLMLHAPEVDSEEIDFDDPDLILKLMAAQSEFIKTPEPGDGMFEDGEEDNDNDDNDDGSLGSMLYGTDVERYFQKTLRVARGKRPTLTLKAGYETASDTYPIELGDAYRTKWFGDTPAEVAVITQLNDESFRTIDSELVQEFEEALIIVGILKRRKTMSS